MAGGDPATKDQAIASKAGMKKGIRNFEAKQPLVLYLGDHDPSGLNISRVARQKIERSSAADRLEKGAVTNILFEQMRHQFAVPTRGPICAEERQMSTRRVLRGRRR